MKGTLNIFLIFLNFFQCLIDIGDKPSNFVGSKKWIGSLELSFCLQNMFNITSKILTSKSGSDLAEHARALIFHFENGGAPVMIGYFTFYFSNFNHFPGSRNF